MSGRMVLVCASSMLLLITGCTFDSLYLSLLAQSPSGQHHVLTGSLEVVSLSTQAALEEMGLRVTVTNSGEEARISSRTQSGDDFTLILTRQTRNGQEATQITIAWDARPDTGFWLELIEVVARVHLKQGKPASSSGRR